MLASVSRLSGSVISCGRRGISVQVSLGSHSHSELEYGDNNAVLVTRFSRRQKSGGHWRSATLQACGSRKVYTRVREYVRSTSNPFTCMSTSSTEHQVRTDKVDEYKKAACGISLTVFPLSWPAILTESGITKEYKKILDYPWSLRGTGKQSLVIRIHSSTSLSMRIMLDTTRQHKW